MHLHVQQQIKMEDQSKMRKVWKTYQSGPCTLQEMIMRPVGQWRGLIQPHNPILMGEVEHIAWNHVEAFLELGCQGDERVWERKRVLDERIWEEKIILWGNEREAKSIFREKRWRENVKRWGRWGEIRRKRKETASNRQKNLKRREGLVAKLLVI